MIVEERHQRILDELGRRPFLSGTALASRLGVSRATIHRDLELLTQTGMARRVRGGVARVADAPPQFPSSFNERKQLFAAEKDRIGRSAARLVNDGDTIIMDGGTTTSSMATYLVAKKINVITNSLSVADYLADHSAIEVIVVGGLLYRASKVLLGTTAIASLRQMNATRTFVSTGGLTFEGVGHSDSLVVETEKQMIARGAEVVLLADHSKFLAGAAMKVCPWNRISRVITDRQPPCDFAVFFKRKGIAVTIA